MWNLLNVLCAKQCGVGRLVHIRVQGLLGSWYGTSSGAACHTACLGRITLLKAPGAHLWGSWLALKGRHAVWAVWISGSGSETGADSVGTNPGMSCVTLSGIYFSTDCKDSLGKVHRLWLVVSPLPEQWSIFHFRRKKKQGYVFARETPGLLNPGGINCILRVLSEIHLFLTAPLPMILSNSVWLILGVPVWVTNSFLSL